MLTIANILDDQGIAHKNNRSACVIHGGDNLTAFHFDDETYYCHTRGCRGNTITLLKHLLNTDYAGVVKYVEDRWNIHMSPDPPVPQSPEEYKKAILSLREQRKDKKKVSARLRWLKWDRDYLQAKYEYLSAWLYRWNSKHRDSASNEYLWRRSLAEFKLERLDKRLIELNWEIKQDD